MSGDGLFHIDETGRLVAMRVTPYAAEEVLQGLLASHPDLLAGGQMTPEDPRRWLLVQREHGVPDHEDAGGARWSLDHLFVDQDAVPTLIEVKRSTDTRIRREVVGQMLDYAANGVRYWPAENLRLSFEQTQAEVGRDPEEAIHDLCRDPAITVEGFFAQVADNLRAGRIRMAFVADVVPDELRRIVEFLNEQMNPAEVFAVEVKQYLADGYPGKTLVPAVYGRTATASRKAPARRVGPQALLANAEPSTRALLERFEEWAAERGLTMRATRSAVQARRPDETTLAQVYLDYQTIDLPLAPLRQRGNAALADACLQTLRTFTTKQLTQQVPSLPAADALAHWEELREVLDQMVEP